MEKAWLEIRDQNFRLGLTKWFFYSLNYKGA